MKKGPALDRPLSGSIDPQAYFTGSKPVPTRLYRA